MWPSFSKTCRKAVYDLLDGKHSLTGYRANKAWGLPPCDWSWAHKFERGLEKQFKTKHAISVNSGTMALEAAIYALNLPPDSEIITTPYSFSATPASVVLSGHRPVFADVNPYDFTLDPESVKKAITKKTRAIIPVDLFGGLANYEELEKFGLPIISDHCQAVGAQRNGKYTFGNITACSGNGGKNLPMGEGGFCLTDDAKLAERMRLFISHGENFDSPEVGKNGRLPELTACVAYHGLLELEERNQRRIDLAEASNKVFFENDLFGDILQRPYWYKGLEHVYYVYPFIIRSPKRTPRQQLLKEAQAKGVAISGGYITPPLHHYKAFKKYAKGPLPEVDRLSFERLCLISSFTPDKPVSFATETARKLWSCWK